MEEKVTVGQTTENDIKHHTKKASSGKTLLLLGGLVIIVLIALVTMAPKKSPSKYTVGSNKTTAEAPAIPTLPVTVPAAWHVIKTQVYSVTVPTNWEPSILPFKGGASLVLQPHNVAMDPMLVVEAFTAPKGTVEDKVKLHEKYGYKRTDITVAKQPAVLLTAMRDKRTINNKTINTPTQNRIVYLSRGKSIYSIRMYYSSPVPVQIYDDVFNKVVTEFKPKIITKNI